MTEAERHRRRELLQITKYFKNMIGIIVWAIIIIWIVVAIWPEFFLALAISVVIAYAVIWPLKQICKKIF